jgi:hypothetical protein
MEVGYEQNEVLTIFKDNERSFFLQKERIPPPPPPNHNSCMEHINT